MAVNHLVYQGRITKDLEIRQTQSGIDNVSFTLAWSEKYKETERKCFLRCKAWRNTATFLDKYFHAKGSEMTVEGSLETEEWEKDGEKHSQTVLNVDKVHFCGRKQDSQQSTAQPSQPAQADPNGGAFVEVPEGELPF